MTTAADLLAFDELGGDAGVGDELVGAGRSAIGPGPTVVLLHPSGFGPGIMRPFAQLLAEEHPVVLPHRRGYERSAGWPPATSLDDHHDDLLALIEALGLERPVLVGMSAGATLGLGFTVRHREVVGGVVVHEPLLGPLGGPLHRVVSDRIDELLATADEPHHAALFMSSLVGRSEWNGLREDWRLAVDANAALVCDEARLFASFALTEDDVRSLPANVVATVGERSSPLRAEVAAVLADRDVSTRVMPDTRHLPVIEEPTAFAALVGDVVAAARAAADERTARAAERGPARERTEGAIA